MNSHSPEIHTHLQRLLFLGMFCAQRFRGQNPEKPHMAAVQWEGPCTRAEIDLSLHLCLMCVWVGGRLPLCLLVSLSGIGAYDRKADLLKSDFIFKSSKPGFHVIMI